MSLSAVEEEIAIATYLEGERGEVVSNAIHPVA